MWIKWLKISCWIILAMASATLLIAAMQKKEEKKCSSIEVDISGVHDYFFVDEKDVLKLLQKKGAAKGKETSSINLRTIESALLKSDWIEKAELFFDNKQVLHAVIREREPVARIFTMQGSSFYIDSSCRRLPLSDKLTVRVPMFTSFPLEKKVLSKPDSTILADIKTIAAFIRQDSFLLAQVAQVDITAHGTYEIIPVVGRQLIKIGDAQNLEEKFSKLISFYRQVWSKTGFEKYETIDVQYKGQVVAVKRGAVKTMMDTLSAMRAFSEAQKELKRVMNDTVYAAPVAKPAAAVVKDTIQQQKKQTGGKEIPATSNKNQTKAVQKKEAKAVMKKKE